MRDKISILFLFVFLFYLSPTAQAQQFWTTLAVDANLDKAKSLKFSLETEFRHADFADLYYNHTEVGLTKKFNITKKRDTKLSLGGGYRQVFDQKNALWTKENRFSGHVTLDWKLKGFEFSDRNRFEYRVLDVAEDHTRYRNKLTVKAPFKFTKAKIQPFGAFEGFWNLNTTEFVRSRVWAGLGAKIAGPVSVEIYYMRQDSKSKGIWNGFNVFGTKLKISL